MERLCEVHKEPHKWAFEKCSRLTKGAERKSSGQKAERVIVSVSINRTGDTLANQRPRRLSRRLLRRQTNQRHE
ncbi:hypothetical protein EYF80_062340 [Liparis tanakae]|uniref:Uncharacterized protein n=1 Tax=Liparis tanakae TaxID=230148 RepID=A0A4Z2EF61_9TELE|nr:hypothetical protein EYF80_062340 [Liparis tanakae]